MYVPLGTDNNIIISVSYLAERIEKSLDGNQKSSMYVIEYYDEIILCRNRLKLFETGFNLVTLHFIKMSTSVDS